jgi:hypothetical protein
MGMKPLLTELRTPPRMRRRLLFNAAAGCGGRSGSEQRWRKRVCSAVQGQPVLERSEAAAGGCGGSEGGGWTLVVGRK